MLDVRIVGLDPSFVPYPEGWDLQRQVHRSVVSGGPDRLLLLEHTPVYTAGVRTAPHERPSNGEPVVDVDRGGKITWHGPGQLVGYPILALPEPVDVVAHVRRLERVLIASVARLGVRGRQIVGRSGVWVDHEGRQAKVAAIGLRVERSVTLHGFAVNCSNDLAPFENIVPCGIADAGVTTLSAVLGRTLTPRHAVAAVIAEFTREFGDEPDIGGTSSDAEWPRAAHIATGARAAVSA